MKKIILISLGILSLSYWDTQAKQSKSKWVRGEQLEASRSKGAVDFLTSMGWYERSNTTIVKNQYYNGTKRGDRELVRMNKLKNLFDQKMEEATTTERKQRIPQIIHQIWVGPNTPPKIFQASQESIKRLHPDWKYKLWTDADIPGLQLYNQKYYDKHPNYGAKADILRYELLYRYGGIYLDIDFICRKPLDSLLQYDLWAAIQPLDCQGCICNGIIGAVPGNPILEDCIKTLGAAWDTDPKMRKVVQTVGPEHFQRSFMKFIESTDIHIIALPASYFFPLAFEQRDRGPQFSQEKAAQKIEALIKPETFAVHYWAGSWLETKR